MFGYDFVVATTQASINATMKSFLSKLKEPLVDVCFVADDTGNPMPIDYAALKAKAGADPFAVPADADPTRNADVQKLQRARFMAGFRARLGLPKGYKRPTDIPDLVILGRDSSQVTFNMLSSQFDIVELVPGGGYSPASWTRLAQADGAAWIFQSKVDLRLSQVEPGAYEKLPDEVKARIKNLVGQTFSVRQLLFDFANAGLATHPTIHGVTPGTKLYLLLQQYFVGAYFTQMQKDGEPVLGVSIAQTSAPPSTLRLTDLNLEVCPYVGPNGLPIPQPSTGQQRLATLAYLCETANAVLPPPTVFNWNWIDESEQSDWHGVAATRRGVLASYFKTQLQPYVSSNCYLFKVVISWDGPVLRYHPPGAKGGQMPVIRMPGGGPTVLSFSYESPVSSDAAGVNGALGRYQLKETFNVDVALSGNAITITQHFVFWLLISGGAIVAQGNVIDKTIVDTYTLGVSAQGQLVANLSSSTKDDSVDTKVGAFANVLAGGINDIIDMVEDWSDKFSSSRFTDIPLSVVQDFVFPGGRTFAFKSVRFSDHQDLVSGITYVDPS
jgi:hypothetical protein